MTELFTAPTIPAFAEIEPVPIVIGCDSEVGIKLAPIGADGSAVIETPLPRVMAVAGSVPVLKTMLAPDKCKVAVGVGTLMLCVPKKAVPLAPTTVTFVGLVPTTGLGGTAPITIFTLPPVAPVVSIVVLAAILIEPTVVLSCSNVMAPLLAVIVAPALVDMSEFPAPVFLSVSRLTKPLPPPLPAAIVPLTLILPNVAPTKDCVKTVMFVEAVKLVIFTLPESATKIGPFVVVMLVRFSGPGPAKLSVYDVPACDVPTVTAVNVCVSMMFENPPVVDEKFVLTTGNAPALSVPMLPVPLSNVNVPPWMS